MVFDIIRCSSAEWSTLRWCHRGVGR